MNTVLVIAIVLLAIMVVVSLVRGIVAFNRPSSTSKAATSG
jgi:hypothetical protein